MIAVQARALVICTLLIPVSAIAQEAKWGNPEDPTVKEMLAGEKMWLDSNCSPQPGLQSYFAEEFQGTATDGKRYGRERLLAHGSDRAFTFR